MPENRQIKIDEGTANHKKALFKPKSWLDKIDIIHHLVLFSNLLISVFSEKEGGKTSFSELLLNNLDEQIKSVSLTITGHCVREKIITKIASQLHLNVYSEASIMSIVSQINERNAYVLLVIDNAQYLPESLVRELIIAIKSQGDFGFFHLCLISDYSLVATLNNLVTDQFSDLIYNIELGLLSESETITYVQQRAITTHLINKPLTDIQCKRFYQLTKGNLSKINNNLESFVFNYYSEEKRKKKFLVKKLSLALSAVIISSLTYVYFSALYQVHHPSDKKVITTATASIVEEIKPDSISIEKQLPSYIASYHESAIVQLMHYPLPKKQILTESLNTNKSSLTETALVTNNVMVFPREIAAIPSTQEDKKLHCVKRVELTKPIPITKDTHANANHYTIQIASSRNLKELNDLKKSNKLLAAAKIRYFKSINGKWYVLTLSEYNTREQAQNGINKLPARLAKFNPWVRTEVGSNSRLEL